VAVDLKRAEDGDTHGLNVDLFPRLVKDADISLIPLRQALDTPRAQNRWQRPQIAAAEEETIMTRRSSTSGLTAAFATIAILLTACTGDARTPASADDEPATSTPTESSPSSQPAPSPTDWTPLEDDGEDGILPPGRYGLNARADTPWAVAEVPAGFSHFGEWALLNEDRDGDGGGVGYMTVSEVYRYPCGGDVWIDVGNTVEDLAAAFRQQRLTRVTAPAPTTIDGYQGLYLELHSPPKGFDFADCRQGNYYLWYSNPIGDRYLQSPGIESLWILDVEGEVVVLFTTESPARTPRAHASSSPPWSSRWTSSPGIDRRIARRPRLWARSCHEYSPSIRSQVRTPGPNRAQG